MQHNKFFVKKIKKLSKKLLTNWLCYDIIFKRWDAGVAQLVEQLICNQQVGGSSPSTSSIFLIVNMGVFPSGQRGQTVNLLTMSTVVRIHPLPPEKRPCQKTRSFFNEIRLSASEIALRWNTLTRMKYLLRKC